MADDQRAMNARTIGDVTWQFARAWLQEQWSPDQISKDAEISIETACQSAYDDKREGGYLLCQKQRRNRYGKV